MENVIICEIPIGDKIKDINITENDFTIFLNNNDGIKLVGVHPNQECCEYVYADWEYINSKKISTSVVCEKLVIKGVPGDGILLVFEYGWGQTPVKEFIPCYNVQSGYYSSALILEIYKNNNLMVTYDIQKFIENVDH